MSPNGFRTLIDGWLGGTAERFEKIASAAAAGEIEALRREAHAMISTAGGVGAARLANLARDLEQACVKGDATAVAGLAHRLQEAATPTFDAMHRHMQKVRQPTEPVAGA